MINVLPQTVKLKETILDFLFPQWCVGCGREGNFLCDSCRDSLPRIAPPVCPKCGKPQAGGTLCPSCADQQVTIDGVRSPFRFEGVIRQAVHQLKYKNLRALAVPLARLLADYLITNPLPGEVLVPVPLHQKRLRERGYNQSSLLVRELGRLTGLPVIDDCLIRKRYAPPQTRTATVEERQSNVVDTFACRNNRLEGKQALLVDDVSTSGATLDACATALKASGAITVWGLVLAREV